MGGKAHNQTRVLLGEDHGIVADGIRKILQNESLIVDVVGTGALLLQSVRNLKPDLVIADITLPDISGLDVLRTLRAEGATVPFLILTMHAEPLVARAAMKAGAQGFLVKSVAGSELVAAVQDVLAGVGYVSSNIMAQCALCEGVELTVAQREVLRRLVHGLSAKQIASELDLSVRTVESHKYTLLRTFGVHTSLSLVTRVQELGLLL